MTTLGCASTGLRKVRWFLSDYARATPNTTAKFVSYDGLFYDGHLDALLRLAYPTLHMALGPLLSTCVRLLLEFSTCTDQLSFLVMLLLIRIMPDLIASPVYLLPCFDSTLPAQL